MRSFSKFNLAEALSQAPEHFTTEFTFGELIDAYQAVHLDDTQCRLKKWTEAFGTESAWSIASDKLEIAAQAMIEHGYSPATANRDLSSIGSVYKWAKGKRFSPRGHVSPTINIRRFEESIRRVHLEPQQVENMKKLALAFEDRRFGAFVHLLFDTGARKSEILNRTWADLDLDRREILAPMTKNGTPRVLFFSEQTAMLIKRVFIPRPSQCLLFEGRVPNSPIDYRASWRKLRQEVGIEDFRIHDARHVSAANLLRAGVTLPVASQVLGHDPAVLARRYGHLETRVLKSAQELAWKQN